MARAAALLLLVAHNELLPVTSVRIAREVPASEPDKLPDVLGCTRGVYFKANGTSAEPGGQLFRSPGGDWSEHKSLPTFLKQDGTLDGHLDKDERQLFRAMRAEPSARRVSRTKPVMWVHVHKSAGSLMCSWAQKMGEKVVQPSQYCASDEFGDARIPIWVDWVYNHTCPMKAPDPELTCAKRAEYFKNFTWGSFERFFYPGDLCVNDFDLGIMVRHPIARMISQVNYEGPEKYPDIIDCIEKKNASDPYCMSVDQKFMIFTYTLFDNFVIRSLLGPAVWYLPAGHIHGGHLYEALTLLTKFKMVLPMERMTTKLAQSKMDQALGWHISANSQKVRSSTNTKDFDDDLRVRLLDINKFDMVLYNEVLNGFDKEAATM